MRAIVGRLSDLGVRELFKLLASAEAEGRLLVETPVGRSELLFKGGEVCGEIGMPLVVAYASRSGSFSFRPEPVAGEGWMSPDDVLSLLTARAGGDEGSGVGSAASGALDPLGELRESLAEIPLAQTLARLGVVTADPRPYRALEGEWRRRGWEAHIVQEPRWPEEAAPEVLILHLPAAGTLAGQESAWLALAQRASAEEPPVPTLWIGGMADPELRHHAIVAGAEFLLPAPLGEVGEAARWFREEVTLLVERLLARRSSLAENAAEAFRDFFLALHMDASPAELRASLLRAAARSFRCGLLLAVRTTGFETLGGFGLGPACPRHLPRGAAALEHVVALRRAIRFGDLEPSLKADLTAVLPGGEIGDGEILPLFAGGECVGLFIGEGPRRPGENTAALAMLFARLGAVVPH